MHALLHINAHKDRCKKKKKNLTHIRAHMQRTPRREQMEGKYWWRQGEPSLSGDVSVSWCTQGVCVGKANMLHYPHLTHKRGEWQAGVGDEETGEGRGNVHLRATLWATPPPFTNTKILQLRLKQQLPNPPLITHKLGDPAQSAPTENPAPHLNKQHPNPSAYFVHLLRLRTPTMSHIYLNLKSFLWSSEDTQITLLQESREQSNLP